MERIDHQNTTTLSPPQEDVVNCGLLNSGFNCILQMPTGSGKTWLAEQAIRAVLRQGARAVYLTPLRALATELCDKWQVQFADHKVGVFTGDYGANNRPFPVSFRAAQLFVMTPERLDACTRAWRSHWSWLPEVDLVVVDELHLLGDSRRGARLEGALSRVRRLNPFARIMGLSATLGNRNELAKWLDGIEYGSEWRPVPLEWRFVRYSNANDKPQLLIKEVKRNLDCGGKSLVFVQSRRRAEELSRLLQSQNLRARHHHAGLDYTMRREVEHDFRSHKLDALVATSTLEMGINLPVRQVVLYDVQTFDGYDFRPLSTTCVWQRIGRAGRRGLDTAGEAVLLIPAWDRAAENYRRGAFEPIRSAFADPRALAEQIVAEVASGMSRTPAQLRATFKASLAAWQGTLPNIEIAIKDMRRAGMIADTPSEDDARSLPALRATRLGRIATRHMLAPASLLLFQRVLQKHTQLTFFDILLLTACSNDCEPLLPVDFEELDALAYSLAKEHSFLLQLSRWRVAESLGVDGKRLLAALKMAVVARIWTRISDAHAVAEQNDCYPFEVERLRESMMRLLIAMSSIFARPDDDHEAPPTTIENAPLRERVRCAYSMIAEGLDEYGVTLTLVDGIGPKTAKRLQGEGVADIEQLAQLRPADLATVRGLTPKRLKEWIAEARRVIVTHSAFVYRETAPPLSNIKVGWSADVDPYRLRRALDLVVGGDDGGTLLVTGGLEPHLVRTVDGHVACDCVDASRNYQCKHMLAVRLHRGDHELETLARELKSKSTRAKLNIFDLWFEQHSTARRRIS
jgi:helicase